MIDRASTGRALRRRVCALASVALLVACGTEAEPGGADPTRESSSFGGEIMGTTWKATVVSQGPLAAGARDEVQHALEGALAAVDASMSTWKPSSDLSRFNHTEVDAPMVVDAGLLTVVQIAKQVHAATDGAFDPTVGPLVVLYGFGPEPTFDMPDAAAINRCLEAVGLDRHIEVDAEAGTLTRTHPDVELDLSAIAKGWAVDHAVEALAKLGHRDVLVEVGGEVVASGERAGGGPWRLGIEDPGLVAGRARELPPARVLLSGAALATSGDYRNWHPLPDGGRISHTVDPRTGHPATAPITSASVIAPTCAEADALATALMVLGEKGLPLIERRDDVEALLRVREEDGLRAVKTSGWDAYTPDSGSEAR